MINEIVNTCYVLTQTTQGTVRVLASYSHVIPIVLSSLLAIFVFIKTKFNFFSKVFLAFVIVFSLWLIGDLVTWTSNNYNLVYTTWSFLDYVEIVFYVVGLYFALVFVKKSDISTFWKITLFSLTIPAFWLTIIKQSVFGFNYPICEAFNNDFLGVYKLVVEGIILAIILFNIIKPFFKKLSLEQKKADLVVLGSMFLFLSIFGVTEYLASVTGYYEMNLYSLFLLPVFLIAIIYSVFELDIFNVKILGSHYLVVGFIIIMGGQLFFTSNTTTKLLTILSLISLVGISGILFRNLKRESNYRLQIEKLNIQLKESNSQLSEFMSFASHEIKGPTGFIKGIASMALGGDLGELTPKLKEALRRIYIRSNDLIDLASQYLNKAKIELSQISYAFEDFDIGSELKQVVEDFQQNAIEKGITVKYDNTEKEIFAVKADKLKIKEVFRNFIGNAIKFTTTGSVVASISKTNDSVLIKVKDTGNGIEKEKILTLFKKFSRADTKATNAGGSGLGLYLAKVFIEAHHGKTWVESEGIGKGTTFFIELPTKQ